MALKRTLIVCMTLSLTGFSALAEAFSTPPPYPGIESWTFREELAKPQPKP